MGPYLAKLARPFKNYNIENRAFRELENRRSAKIGKAAPRHSVDLHQNIDSLTKADVEQYRMETEIKNNALIERVRRMNIKSGDTDVSMVSKRPLPTDVSPPTDLEYGFKIPENVPKGKATLSQAIEILTKYKDQYPRYTVADIAEEYRLCKSKVAALVEHFQTLNIFLPKKVLEKAEELEKKRIAPSVIKKLTTIQGRNSNMDSTSTQPENSPTKNVDDSAAAIDSASVKSDVEDNDEASRKKV